MPESSHAVAAQRLAPGALVTARGREWVVLPETAPDMIVLRPLGGADDEIAAVFPDLEDVAPATFPAPDPADLGDARTAGLLRTALRVGFRSSAGPFRSLASIAVEPRPYQLVPLLMAMRQRCVRIAICDDVGIGKTIESGLIAAELLAQGEAKGLAILCSPALAEQWQDELRHKFGIDAELILASTAPRLERGLALGESLFQKYQRVVISTDFIKSPKHRDDFLKYCADLVIVDEAHTCVPADGAGGAGGGATSAQLRYKLLTRLAANPERHLILVTATPHSGKDESFRALVGLLDPDLAKADLTMEAGRRQLAACYVQRRRADIRHYLNEDTEFPGDRLFRDAAYSLTPEYRELLDDAIAYASERVTVAGAAGRREQRVAWWSAIALLRSLVSSPRAAEQTLRTRSVTAAATSAAEADVLGRQVTADMAEDNPDGIDASPGADDAAPGGADASPGTASAPADPARARLLDLSERAKGLQGPERDKKLAELIKILKALLKEGRNPIVFCRYIPTSEYLYEHLDGQLGRRTVVEYVNGTQSPAQRIDRIDKLAKATEDGETRRVLIATDCLSEGVNLQHSFDAVIHYDLAWNPTRHEQREGRVDRYGQKSKDVRVVTLYGGDNGIDGKVLEVLIRKHREIRKLTGISVPVPDEASSQVTDAIVEWLLLRSQGRDGSGQAALFDLDEVVAKAGGEFESQWSSTADRESRSRSRFAQGTIHPDEVAREIAAIRTALGQGDEVRAFTRNALRVLGADLTIRPDGGFSVTTATLPLGLRDAVASLLGDRKQIPFRTTLAVGRGEAALTRTDPVVAAVANFVLTNALDRTVPDSLRPARRCGVIRTSAVAARTTLLLVRYRFQLTLPGRYGDLPLIAEDARVLGFTGAPARAAWLDDDAALTLLRAEPDELTDTEFARSAITRILDGLPDVTPHVNQRAGEFAAELRDAHRRVRGAASQAVRGLTVTPAGDADILGVYVYLPYVNGTDQ